MTNPIMSDEQWAALVEMFDAGDYAEWVAARDKARRLLVADPEQPKHNGPCVGGPLDGSLMAMDDEIVQIQGGEYQWSGFEQNWEWVADVDPDLTTFGTIPRGHRFQALGDDPVIARKVFRRVYDSFLRHGRNAVDEATGKLWQIGDDEPVRRLPQ